MLIIKVVIKQSKNNINIYGQLKYNLSALIAKKISIEILLNQNGANVNVIGNSLIISIKINKNDKIKDFLIKWKSTLIKFHNIDFLNCLLIFKRFSLIFKKWFDILK